MALNQFHNVLQANCIPFKRPFPYNGRGSLHYIQAIDDHKMQNHSLEDRVIFDAVTKGMPISWSTQLRQWCQRKADAQTATARQNARDAVVPLDEWDAAQTEAARVAAANAIANIAADTLYTVQSIKEWICELFPPIIDRQIELKDLNAIQYRKNEDPNLVHLRIQREINSLEQRMKLANAAHVGEESWTIQTPLTDSEKFDLYKNVFVNNNEKDRGEINKKVINELGKKAPQTYDAIKQFVRGDLRRKICPQYTSGVDDEKMFTVYPPNRPYSGRKRDTPMDDRNDHQPPRSRQKSFDKPCQWGANCVRRRCRFQHPVNWQAPVKRPNVSKKSADCRYGAACTNGQCQFWHPNQRRPQKNDKMTRDQRKNDRNPSRSGQSSNNAQCRRCGRAGHVISQCRAANHVNGNALGTAMQCYRCHRFNHRADECTSKTDQNGTPLAPKQGSGASPFPHYEPAQFLKQNRTDQRQRDRSRHDQGNLMTMLKEIKAAVDVNKVSIQNMQNTRNQRP